MMNAYSSITRTKKYPMQALLLETGHKSAKSFHRTFKIDTAQDHLPVSDSLS